jgi:hypothetical protein
MTAQCRCRRGFVGAPLTPESLNDGKYNCNAAGENCTMSNFPEYHPVYIEQTTVDAYLKTGDFPEGTVIVKVVQRTPEPLRFAMCLGCL